MKLVFPHLVIIYSYSIEKGLGNGKRFETDTKIVWHWLDFRAIF